MTALDSEITINLRLTLFLLALSTLAAVAYVVRVLVWGKARFARVDSDGGSILLGKGLMEMAYWAIQPIARVFVFLRLGPHHISWMSLAFGIPAAFALAYGHFGLGAVLATWSAFCDTLDGCVARMLGVASNTGEILDSAVDRYCEFFFLGGLLLYYKESTELILLVLAAMVGTFMVSYASSKAEAVGVVLTRGIMRRPERGFYMILGAALSPISISWWEPPSSHPLGYPMILVLVLVAVLSNIAAVYRMVQIVLELKKVEANTKAFVALAEGESHRSET